MSRAHRQLRIASLLLDLGSARTGFEGRMRLLRAWMEDNRLSAHLADRVARYYSYVWSRRHGVDEGALLRVGEPGVSFRSYRDGRTIELTPESSVAAQKAPYSSWFRRPSSSRSKASKICLTSRPSPEQPKI